MSALICCGLGVKLAGHVRDVRPESANNHFIVIERVIEVGDDSPEVDATNAGNGRLSVWSSGAWKRRDDLERLFEFLREYSGVVAVPEPPGFLSPNVCLRGRCEPNAAVLQRDRSSRTTTSASTRRSPVTSSPESFRA